MTASRIHRVWVAMQPFDPERISPYIDAIAADPKHRYRSWEICHGHFRNRETTESHALHLAFYLASWGMYRGSSGLLQKNHMIHQEPVNTILSTDYDVLYCDSANDVSQNNIELIAKLSSALSQDYSRVRFDRGRHTDKTINPTDTLISKVMLGTLACVPAYDRYFIAGLKASGLKHTKFGRDSLAELFAYVGQNEKAVAKCQIEISRKLKTHYPRMKILDMYFWQIGFDAN